MEELLGFFEKVEKIQDFFVGIDKSLSKLNDFLKDLINVKE